MVGVIGRDSGRDISMQWDSLKGYGNMIRSDWASAIRMAHDFVRRLWSLKLFAG